MGTTPMHVRSVHRSATPQQAGLQQQQRYKGAQAPIRPIQPIQPIQPGANTEPKPLPLSPTRRQFDVHLQPELQQWVPWERKGKRKGEGQALFLQIAPTPIQPRPNSSTPSSSSSSSISSSSSTTGPERLTVINSLNTGHLSSSEQTRPTQNTHTIM